MSDEHSFLICFLPLAQIMPGPPIHNDDASEAPVVHDHELLRSIGRGGYGVVWLGRNIMETYRAVKIVYRRRFENDRDYEREFKGITKFEPLSRTHPNLVNILHVAKEDAAGYFYYVMELADDASQREVGVHDAATPEKRILPLDPDTYVPDTLLAQLRQREVLPIPECVALGLSLASALECLHANKLTHRDVKPGNVIFVNGIPKLADVGLVALIGEAKSNVGTTGYTPPEGSGTAQADIYSLGKVLYEISSGNKLSAFPDPPANILELPDPELFAEFNEVIVRACESDLKARYRSAAEMRAELQSLQAGKSVRQVRVLKRRLRLLVESVVTLGIIAIVVVTALFFYQQAAKVRALGQQARQFSARLASLHGQSSDYSGSLLWYAEALKQEAGDPKRARLNRLRLKLTLQTCPQLLQIFFHSAAVTHAEFSPDGRKVLTVSEDGTAKIWNAETGEPITLPVTNGSAVSHATFSPDGRRFATACCDFTARVWDVETAKPVAPPLSHTNQITSISFSPDSRLLLTSSTDGTACVWDAQSAHLIITLRHGDAVLGAKFSPDGTKLVTASAEGTARLWDGRTGSGLGRPLSHGTNPVNDVCFSPNGDFVATGGNDDTVRLWAAATGEPVFLPWAMDDAVGKVTFSPDGRLVAAANASGLVRFFSVDSGAETYHPFYYRGGINQIAFSPDGDWIVSASIIGVATVSHVPFGVPGLPELWHAGRVLDASISSDGDRILTASTDGTARIWSLVPRPDDSHIIPVNQDVRQLGFSPDGRRLFAVSTTNSDGSCDAHLWDPGNDGLVIPPLKHNGEISHAVFSPDGKVLVTVSLDRAARLWDSSDGKLLGTLTNHSKGVLYACFGPNPNQLVTTSQDGTARMWDIRLGREICRPLPHGDQVVNAAFNRKGTMVVTASGNVAQVWDAVAGIRLGEQLEHDDAVVSAVFAPDDAKVLTASADRTMRLWRWDNGEELARQPHFGTVNQATFSADGQKILTASEDGRARVWDAEARQLLVPELSHNDEVWTADFSPDGDMICSVGKDKTVRLWNANTGDSLGVLYRQNSEQRTVAFDPKGRCLATAHRDKTVRIWDLDTNDRPTEDWMRLAQLLSSRTVSPGGVLASLSPQAFRQLWQDLRSRYPQEFIRERKAVLDWHAGGATDGEERRAWFLAIFHLALLSEARPTDETLKARLRHAQAELQKMGSPAPQPDAGQTPDVEH